MANFWDEYNQKALEVATQGRPQVWADFEKIQRIQELANKRKTDAAKPKKGNILTDLLPTIGGTGGALGGAAAGAGIGTALLPGIGTALGGLAGALIGGAGGSAIGKVGENAAEGEADLGKDVGMEALIGGATSLPITGGLKLARAGVKAATGGSSQAAQKLLLEGGGSAIPSFAKGAKQQVTNSLASLPVATANRTGRLASIGTDAQRNVMGTGKVADSFSQETSLVDALNRNGLKGSATNMYKNLDGTLGNLSGQIDSKLATIPGTIARPTAIDSLQKRVAELVPSDPTYTRELTRSLERLNKSSAGDVTASELFGFKKDLGNRLKPAFDKMSRGAPLTAKEEVDMALWRGIDDDITKLAPEVKSLTRDQSALITARPGVKASANKTAGVPLLGIKSQRLEQAKQAVSNRVGAAANGMGSQSAPGMIKGQALSVPIRQEIGREVFNPDPLPVELDENGLAQEDYQTLANEGIGAEPTDTSMVGLPEEPTNAFGVSKEQVGREMVAALQSGDLKGFSALKELYALIGAESAASSKPMSAEASKTVGNANTGLQSLSQLENIISQNGGKVSAATLVPFREAMGNFGANALGTAGYDTATKNIADVITRLRTGAAITPSEEAYYKSMLPQTFDEPEVIQQKLQTFKDLFQSVSSRTGSTSNLEDVLAGLS